MKFYEILKEIVERNNKIYLEYLEKINKETDKEKIKVIEDEKWQFTHDYATELTDLLLTLDFASVKPKDFELLDMVPYIVWNKVKATARLVANQFHKVYLKEKF